jgi:predicted RNA-binding protein with PIN domain
MPKRLLLVDGYNVLRSGNYYADARQGVKDFGDEVYNAAREALINDVAQFAGHDYDVLIVFDGAGNRFSDGQTTRIGGIEVLFSPTGVSADTVIEERAKRAAARGLETLVVTSDAATQWTVIGNRVTRMSAAGFCQEIKAIRTDNEPDGLPVSQKNTLGERLSPDILKELRERYGQT